MVRVGRNEAKRATWIQICIIIGVVPILTTGWFAVLRTMVRWRSMLVENHWKLEITETVIMVNNRTKTAVMKALTDRNLDLHMNDFGTGYSPPDCDLGQGFYFSKPVDADGGDAMLVSGGYRRQAAA